MTTRSALLVSCFSLRQLGGWGCGASRTQVPPGTADADKFLFTRGEEEFKDKNWVKAREYYRQIVDNYPQSPFRPDAKLAVGDTLHRRAHDRVAAPGRERVPRVPHVLSDQRARRLRAVPARLRVSRADARARSRSIGHARRRQGAGGLHGTYPNSALLPDAKKLLREAKDRLSEASYRVGYTITASSGIRAPSIGFKDVLKDDPEFTHRDAVYFYLAEALRLSNLKDTAKLAEALPYYERIIKEFETSEYLENAKKRIAELKTP